MTPATKTILICDDDQGMRDTIAAILGRDYRVLTVSSGEAGLAILRQEDVDSSCSTFVCPASADSTSSGSSRRTTASSSAS